MLPLPGHAPIGVFDSGIGGLSVLRALQAELPRERYVYFADGACTPYGPRGTAYVTARSLAIADHLVRQHRIKALVVACNTATAAAIETLRAHYPQLVVVGVEPAIKPAAAISRTGHVGVLATRGTLASRKFARLQSALGGRTRFTLQPCAGLAEAIERSALGDAAAVAAVSTLCARYLALLGPLGPQPGAIDTVVLGCTHYVFAETTLQHLAGPAVYLLDTGRPVARHTHALLAQRGLLAPPKAAPSAAPSVALQLCTSGDPALLSAAAQRWLPACRVRATRALELAPGVNATAPQPTSPAPTLH